MIDFDALGRTALRTEPYAWASVEQAFDPARAEALIDTFPSEDFWELAGDDGEKTYLYDARPLVIAGEDGPPGLSPLSAVWQEVVDDLLSPRYRETLGRVVGLSLDGALMEARLMRWPNDAHLGPHRDLETKVLTQVFYLNAGWNPSWGGALRILRSQEEEDLTGDIQPLLGTSSILVRSERSWHAVPAVRNAPVPRRSLIVTWFHPGSTSPGWYHDDDGVVRATAEATGGARRHAAPVPTGLAALEAHTATVDARVAELTAVRERRSVRAALAAAGTVQDLRTRIASARRAG